MLKSDDLKMGSENEDKNVHKLEKHFKLELLKDTNKYSIFDWFDKSNTVYLELKSRRLMSNSYNTTIIGLNKIRYCTNPDIKYYFCFAFNDGLFYIKFDKELFKTFKTEILKINYRSDVKRQEFNDVIHIPTNLLKKIN
jgi:hypothetical protein